ncbi:non-structural maintenance of chromosomes element 1 homolog [Rana temporaria]|uniref:non-structural maintenance of chromosomes element 1 homolog n=1 Tax=Rana temporaria TaxID=8407 RepID=UPI001AAD7488|nr:non-structural maintenance of chromosomes element 1 homolog [Rana temporaria]XP_040212646.1 non-structural maintenance of chromosomes element 1 homolog [Rana temporaria]XP_040212647.1 non-structural maintenance of chromosomes element 1 homolog [Rana temporaria]
MNQAHQRFLQVLMSHGILEASVLRGLHRHCCEVHKVQYMHDKLDDFVSIINKHLQPVFMQIRKGTDENDGKKYYALLNLAENDVTKMASDFGENELELFRKTMDLIIDSDSGFASSTNILNLADQLQTKKMKKKEIEQLLQQFVQDKWLIEKEGEYSLHTRSIMELEHYIQITYQDVVKQCNICHNIAIQGHVCENCGIKIHLTCVEKYFRGQSGPRCPQCTEQWMQEIPIFSQASPEAPSTSQVSRVEGRRKIVSTASTRTRRHL